MVEQPEILEHDADAPPQCRQRVLAERRDIVAEQRDQSARGPQRQEQQAQEGGLAGARRAGEKLERLRVDAKGQIAQDLGTEAVAQPYMLEPNHVPLPARVAPHTADPGLHALPCARSL